MKISKKEIEKRKEFDTNKLILRDYLAISRSKLANERTLLAYVRTGFMFFVSGLSLIKLFPTETIWVFLGYSLIPMSVFTIILGIIRFRQTERDITKSYKMKKVYEEDRKSFGN
ncbi:MULTISPECIES: DUF202 domain-containing protein [unclassified Kosmotoga]|uniref:DUF202 domain-containing protein n=1 Tax=unclassified Kosmotoga TaxID=2631489 RepID=UPI000ACF639B|nr:MULTISPECIES: DUF202 domain-containing protein [unclassified Kosmotoga]